MPNLIKFLLVVLLAIVALPLLLAVFAGWILSSLALWFLVMIFWKPRGIRYLIVYSESQQWRQYFESDVLPAFEDISIVLNLSKDGGQKKWWHLNWIIYRHCAGYRNRFPIVIRFTCLGAWRAIRFYDAFIQAKKGKTEALELAKSRIDLWKEKRA
jgi:hypothetical protein